MEKLRNLRRFRKAKGMTQNQLAEYVGVSASAISQYESGGKVPSFEVALKIAETLDCESIDLVTTRTGIYDALNDSGVKKEPATNSDGLEFDASIITDKDKRLLNWFRSLPQEKQKAILISQDAPKDLL